jgi:phenylacetate-coenzyme A ligase PaaK-like adenylate-forming protein
MHITPMHTNAIHNISKLVYLRSMRQQPKNVLATSTSTCSTMAAAGGREKEVWKPSSMKKMMKSGEGLLIPS